MHLHALRYARTSPLEGRLVSAYRKSTGKCACVLMLDNLRP